MNKGLQKVEILRQIEPLADEDGPPPAAHDFRMPPRRATDEDRRAVARVRLVPEPYNARLTDAPMRSKPSRVPSAARRAGIR